MARLPVCSKCGSSLPEGSQFCLKCGHPVSTEAITHQSPTALVTAPAEKVQLERPRYKPPFVLIVLLLVLAGLIAWIGFSDDPTAQELRQEVTGSRTQTIIETPISVKANSFSYYEFTVPSGAVDVAVSGEFNAAGMPGKGKGKDKDKDSDDNIEAYVLTDTAFITWRDGYSTSSYYESGRTAQGAINAKLPAGAGDYYLVFNNKFSPRTAKTIHTTILLHYRALFSETLAHWRQKIWGWVGFD